MNMRGDKGAFQVSYYTLLARCEKIKLQNAHYQYFMNINFNILL